MAESTLNLDQWALEAEVGDFGGFGSGAKFNQTAWDTATQRVITRAVQSGLRMVYFTEEIPPDVPAAYSWSFLKPTSTIAIASGAATTPLPDDFGGLNGDVIPIASTDTCSWPIPVVGPGQLHAAYREASSTTGRPRMACVEAVNGTTPTASNRYQLRVYPTADQAYTATVWYYLLPDATSASLPYVYGGAAHAETFKAAVRAAFEIDQDNKQGPEWVRFITRLKASIAYDRRLKPQTIGPNLDRSDELYADFRTPLVNHVALSVNGVTPG